MSWCCLTSGDERSAIKIEGYARNDDAREALSKLRGASDFYAPHLLNPLNLSCMPTRGGMPPTSNAIKLSGRTFLAPHRGSCPKG